MSQFEQFASDNYSGIRPQVWAAMAEANRADEPAYGEDVWTQRASDGLRTLFNTDCDVYFVFNGTAANSLAALEVHPSEITWKVGVCVVFLRHQERPGAG